MQTVDYNHEDFQSNQGDATAMVRFYQKSYPDEAKTKEEGRPIFKDVDIIEIRFPGDKDYKARPVREGDKRRWPRHWEAYQARISQEDIVEGTPLSEWPQITRSQVEELAFYNVKTVEQLVEMSDSHAQQFMGINNLRRKAQEWLDAAEKGKAAEELQAELAKRDELLVQMQARMEELEKNQKKAPGRKPKAKQEVQEVPAEG